VVTLVARGRRRGRVIVSQVATSLACMRYLRELIVDGVFAAQRSSMSYRWLHNEVAAHPGAADRRGSLRESTSAEIGLHELHRALHCSQTELGLELGISQTAISQVERAGGVKLSALRNYLEHLGVRPEMLAVFEGRAEEHVFPIRIGNKVAS